MLTQKKLSEKQLLYNYSELIVKKYLRFYWNVFLKGGLDADDLNQEAKIVVWNMCNKYKEKPFNEKKKIVSKAVGNRLNVLRKDAGKIMNFMEDNEEEEKDILSYDEGDRIVINSVVDREDEYDFISMDSNNIDFLIDKRKPPEISLSEIRELCSMNKIKNYFEEEGGREFSIKDNLFYIIFKVFFEKQTYREVGEDFGVSRQRIEQILKKLLSEFKKYI